MSDERAGRWLHDFCEEHRIDWDSLSKGEQFQLTMKVPCTIRCFRVGGPVDVVPGEKCPECGKRSPHKGLFDHIQEEDPDSRPV